MWCTSPKYQELQTIFSPFPSLIAVGIWRRFFGSPVAEPSGVFENQSPAVIQLDFLGFPEVVLISP
jgi:hypothetical protein